MTSAGMHLSLMALAPNRRFDSSLFAAGGGWLRGSYEDTWRKECGRDWSVFVIATLFVSNGQRNAAISRDAT